MTLEATSAVIVTVEADSDWRYKELACAAETVTVGDMGAKTATSTAGGVDMERRMVDGALT